MKEIDVPYRNALTQQFILDRIDVDEAGCWIWRMSLDKYGYPLIGPGAQERRAHRLAYVLFVGPIPEPLTVDHLCFVTNCVNPEHLQLLTSADNTRRQPKRTPGQRKVIPEGPKRPTSRSHCYRGHAWVAENLRPRGRRLVCKVCDAERIRGRLRRQAEAAA